MKKFKDKLIRFMYGRYGGNDALSKTLLWGYFIILIVGALTDWDWLWYVGFLALAWNIFRMFSRNIAARQKENAVFLSLRRKIALPFKAMLDRKHAYRTCPHCKATVRLPRKKGRHTVCCPKCREDFKVKI
ncbi:MAG: hypothetical protein IKY33_04620 [Clostridia bacterium]|nr:hypothetical protein [Clostridia bacterium]